MEQTRAYLNCLTQACSDMEVTDSQWQAMSSLTPSVAQKRALEKGVCIMFVMRAARKITEEPSTQIINNLHRALDFIIVKDVTTSKSSICQTDEAVSLNWIMKTIVAIVTVIDCEEHCFNADQKMLIAVDTLKRNVNVAVRSPQYSAAHSDPAAAGTMIKRVVQVMDSLEATIAKTLMGDVSPKEVLDRVRLENECPVCMEAQLNAEEDFALLSGCTHALCVPCARTWCQDNAKCPMCRAQGVFFKKSTLERLKSEA